MCTANNLRNPNLLQSHVTLALVAGLTWSGVVQKLLVEYALMVTTMLFDRPHIFLTNSTWSSIRSIRWLLNTTSHLPFSFLKSFMMTFFALNLESSSTPVAFMPSSSATFMNCPNPHPTSSTVLHPLQYFLRSHL